MVDIKQLLENLPEAPTLVQLREKKGVENLVGSPLVRQRSLNGKEFYFYEDGSVLVHDSGEGFYHFVTSEGKKRLSSSDRGILEDIVYGRASPTRYEKLGSGNFSDSYSLPIAEGVAMKVTNAANFLGKELSDVFSNAYDDLISGTEMGRIGGGKKIVQHVDLKTSLGLLGALRTNGFATPEVYGFSIREKASGEKPQEYQFMQRIDRPTVEQIFEKTDDLFNNPQVNYDAIPHSQIVRNARNHFASDDEMLGALVRAYTDFRRNAKTAIWDIGDMKEDNLFVYGFNPESKEFTIMMIDPIAEVSYIRPIRRTPRDELMKINYSLMK